MGLCNDDESDEHTPEKNKAISYERPCVTVISPRVRGDLKLDVKYRGKITVTHGLKGLLICMRWHQ